MQKKNNKGIIALIIVLVLAAAALVIWQTNKRETQQGGKEITINVDHLNGDDTTFTIHTDEEYLRGALEQEDLIEGTESEYGLYVLTVLVANAEGDELKNGLKSIYYRYRKNYKGNIGNFRFATTWDAVIGK